MIKQKNGFVMMDIVIALAILIIFSVIAIPRLTSFYTVKLFGVANKLATDVQYAQQLAISKQVNCGLSFDPSTDSYFIYEGTTATKAKDPYTRGDFIVSYQSEDTYKGIDLVGTSFGDRVEFNPLGRPHNAVGNPLLNIGEILLQSNGESRKVLIAPNTGAMRVQ